MTRLLALILALACVAVMGCQDSEPAGEARIQSLIADLPTAAEQPGLWEASFAKDAAPATTERMRYSLVVLHAMAIEIQSKTAKVRVLVEDPDGHKLGDTEWTVVNERGAWKLKSAPLP